MSKSKSKSSSTQTQRSTSAPLSADEVKSYTDTLDAMSGGRLNTFATQGTPATSYAGPTDAQLTNLGGLGAMRRRSIDTARARAIAEATADPTLSVFQRSRVNQLADQDAASQLDAVNQEAEAAVTQAAFERSKNQYAADAANNQRLRDDLALLAEIFFGGKGQRSESTGSATSNSSSRGGIGEIFSFNFAPGGK